MKKITLTIFSLLLFGGTIFSQPITTGPIQFTTTPINLSYGAQIDVTATEVTLTLIGPVDRWLGIGFGVSTMTNGEDVVIYSGGTSTNTAGTLSDRTFVGVGSPPTLDTNQNWNLITNDITTQAGARILVATRALDTGVDNDYVFSLADGSINLVWARGNGTLNLSNHGNFPANPNRGATAAGFTLGVEDFELSKFKISPNPVSTEFNIELPNTIETANVDVYDVLGKRIHSSEISNFNSNIDATNWYNGIYLVRVSFGNVSQTKRIIKQ